MAFNFDKTYGPFDGATIVDYGEGQVEVPSGAVLKFETRHVPVITPYDEKEAKKATKKKEPRK